MAGWLYRIGRAAAAHRLVFIGVWLVLVAVAVVSVRALGAETNNTLTLPGTDSQAAFDVPKTLAILFVPKSVAGNSLGRTVNKPGIWISPPPPTTESIKPANSAEHASTDNSE